MESILTSIKKMLGITEEYTQFDTDIIIHINSVFMTLMQLGVGPSKGFYIEDSVAEWTDFVSDLTQIQAVKTYVYLRVRLLFDPGSLGSATLAAYERQIQELEWRLNVAGETDFTSDSSGSTNAPSNDSKCNCGPEFATLNDKLDGIGESIDEILENKPTAGINDRVLVVE